MIKRSKIYQRNHPKSTNRKLAWMKLTGFGFVLGLAILMGGFISFASHIKNQTTPSPIPKADGIVVWTGPGGKRLETAAKLFKEGHGKRLLISGVNEATGQSDLVILLGINADKAHCCLDLDYKAIDTEGNARETSTWARALGYNHIILVTSAYHMPRAQIEFQNSAGHIKITPYPVISSDPDKWWKNRKEFARYIREYVKLVRVMLIHPRDSNRSDIPIVIPSKEPEDVKPTTPSAAPAQTP